MKLDKKEKEILVQQMCDFCMNLSKIPWSTTIIRFFLYSLKSPYKIAVTLTFTNFLKLSCKCQLIMISYCLDVVHKKTPNLLCEHFLFVLVSFHLRMYLGYELYTVRKSEKLPIEWY